MPAMWLAVAALGAATLVLGVVLVWFNMQVDTILQVLEMQTKQNELIHKRIATLENDMQMTKKGTEALLRIVMNAEA